MDQKDSSARRRRRIDPPAKLAFLTALRAGAPRDAAAAGAGFTATAFYNAREADPLFRQAWLWANELSAADEQSALAAGAPTAPDAVIAPNRHRRLQRRRVRRRRFDDNRRRIFLDHFAGTADAHQAAAAAGIGYATVMQHRRRDAEFAAAWDEALDVAYAQLEAEAVRQRLEAQQHLRDGLSPTGEISREFERVLQLLARYRRPDGRIGLRGRGAGRDKRWTFDEAILALDRKLRALGARRGIEADPILPAPPLDPPPCKGGVRGGAAEGDETPPPESLAPLASPTPNPLPDREGS